jgi:hypothetical protein
MTGRPQDIASIKAMPKASRSVGKTKKSDAYRYSCTLPSLRVFRTFGEGYLNVLGFRAVRRMDHFSVISPLNRLTSRGPVKQHHQKCGRPQLACKPHTVFQAIRIDVRPQPSFTVTHVNLARAHEYQSYVLVFALDLLPHLHEQR